MASRTLSEDWRMILAAVHENIIFIDEENSFLPTNEFAEAVRESDNYYVIVTREGLPNLPYSVEEIYGIRESGKYASLTQTYHEFYHIYGRTDYNKPVKAETIVVEKRKLNEVYLHTDIAAKIVKQIKGIEL